MPKRHYKPRADGKFATTRMIGYKADGRPNMIFISADTETELRKKIREVETARDNRAFVRDTDVLTKDYARKWLKTYKVKKEHATYAMYENIIEKHIVPAIGIIPLGKLKKEDIQIMINERWDKARTCEQLLLTTRQICKAAREERIIINDICTGIDLPKPAKKEKRPLTDEEERAVFKAEFTPQERTFVYLIYYCGLRREEALAVERSDINLKQQTIKIDKAVAFKGNEPYLKAPKSPNSYRTIPLPAHFWAYLGGYLPTLDTFNLLPGKGGKWLAKYEYDSMWNRIIHKMNAAVGGNENIQLIHGLTAHIFRHNYCTRLCYQVLAGKISLKKVAQLMGDTVEMVNKVYSHILEEKEDVQGALEDVFGEKISI